MRRTTHLQQLFEAEPVLHVCERTTAARSRQGTEGTAEVGEPESSGCRSGRGYIRVLPGHQSCCVQFGVDLSGPAPARIEGHDGQLSIGGITAAAAVTSADAPDVWDRGALPVRLYCRPASPRELAAVGVSGAGELAAPDVLAATDVPKTVRHAAECQWILSSRPIYVIFGFSRAWAKHGRAVGRSTAIFVDGCCPEYAARRPPSRIRRTELVQPRARLLPRPRASAAWALAAAAPRVVAASVSERGERVAVGEGADTGVLARVWGRSPG